MRVPRLRDAYPVVILAIAVLAMLVLPSFSSSSTVSVLNFYDVFQIFSNYGLIALALGLSIVVGEYDLSTAGAYAFGGVVAIKLGESNPLLGLAAALGVGLVVGLLQGGLVARLKMSAVPVTLGGYLILFGATHVVTHSKTLSYENFDIGAQLDQPILSVFSLRSLITLAVFVVIGLVLQFSRLGPQVRAVGDDRRASRTAGVSVPRVLITVLIISGVCSAAAGALTSYSLASANPDLGLTPMIFGTIAALLGGVSLAGGRGSVAGIGAGVLSYAVLQETLAMMAAPDYVSDLVTGSLLLIVTALAAPDLRTVLQSLRTRVRTGRGRRSTA
ncbi:MAG: ribose transport system permease protein [Thermomicrobiales bacterium]|jgi:ribose/xylose/arabinose/galactoside ABC-type transport system permease subunit|nr:ribose transport system permease protein [Thermomicrobiales bacterium]